MALIANGDFAVVADADAGLLAPDEGPPRAWRCRTDHGSFFGEGLLVGGVGRLAEFAVDFVLVGVRDELVEEVVGPDQFHDVVGGQEGNEAFLPVVVAAFDFAFGLRGGGVEEFDVVEVEGRAELGEGVGVVGIEEGVVVHIKGQGQAVGLENTGEKIEMGQEGFARVEPCAGVEPRGVVEDFQQDLFVGTAGQPSVRGGIVLPEGAVIAGLPAFDGFANGFVAGVGSQFVLEGPAADAGTVGFEVETTMEFAGDGAVGGGRFGSEELGDQGGDFGWPIRVVIATGAAWGPGLRVAGHAGAQVIGVKFVEAGARQSQFVGSGAGAELAGAVTVEQMPDEGSGQAFDQLLFFIGPS
jgi:hypothetical protein